jgi:demethylmenaquinone methyltransferase/2-methoxy-6-polyprenyl-1,4-benzoquinol methylase
MTDKQTTHFGFQEIPVQEKTTRVGEVFQRVAHKYDLMNDVMSLGLHRLWKRFATHLAPIAPGASVLDLAGGTGDLSALFAKKMRYQGRIILSDINPAMLAEGRNRFLNRGVTHPIEYVQANAEQLPFADNSMDLISIGFGLRNVTDKAQALREMARVCKVGGCIMVLEFSQPRLSTLQKCYDSYSFKAIPTLGEWIAKDRESYQYLVESIRKHPDQQALKTMILEAGFDACEVYNLAGGIVAIHKGYLY